MGQDHVRFSRMTPASDESYSIYLYIYICICSAPCTPSGSPKGISVSKDLPHGEVHLALLVSQGLSSCSSSQRSVDFEFEG